MISSFILGRFILLLSNGSSKRIWTLESRYLERWSSEMFLASLQITLMTLLSLLNSSMIWDFIFSTIYLSWVILFFLKLLIIIYLSIPLHNFCPFFLQHNLLSIFVILIIFFKSLSSLKFCEFLISSAKN